MSSMTLAFDQSISGNTAVILYITLILIAFSLLPYSLFQVFFTGKKPPSLPWAPSGEHGVVAALQSAVKTTINIREAFTRSQLLPNAKSSGYVMSTVLDGTMVVLPLQNLKWLSGLPESTLSSFAAHESRLQLSYTAPSAVLTEPDLAKFLVKLLTRHTKSVIPEIHNEVETVCEDAAYGTLAWQPLCLSTEILRILTATSNRMLIGLPLCRDTKLLRLFSSYSRWAVPSALFIRLFPWFLRPVVGRAVRAIRFWIYYRKLLKALLPLIRKQKQAIDGADSSTELGETFIVWWIKEANKNTNKNPKTLDPEVLAQVIIQLNFAGTHATSLATINVLYHILSFEHAADLISDLRNEIDEATRCQEGYWTWACVEKMRLLDSVIRESMRIAPIDSTFLGRMVMRDIETPDGLQLPIGTKVCLPGLLANLDDKFYDDSTTFNPYRFVAKDDTAIPETSSFVSDHFTSFGYGAHSCPGRWFATAEMKLIIAHLLAHYDFQTVPEMPRGFNLGTMMIPSPTCKVNVRARQSEASV